MDKRSIAKNVSWLAFANIAAKGLGLAQTVLLARALGIRDYGVFGFIVGTLGVAASLAGMQLGMTSTVFVAQNREKDPSNARRIVTELSLLTLVVCIAATALTAPASRLLTHWLIGEDGPVYAVLIATMMLPAIIGAGVLEGLASGFEDFRSVAITNLAQALITLALIYPAARWFGVVGAVATMGLGLSCRVLWLALRVGQHARSLPASQATSHEPTLRTMVGQFALPAMLTSLAASGSTWFGSYLLSRQEDGFTEIALVTVATQWRTPIILLATIVGTVVIPAMSAKFARGDHKEVRAIKHGLLKWTGLAATAVTILVSLASPLLLKAYGQGFSEGSVILSVIVASAVPQVIATSHLQQLVAEGEAWRQLWLTLQRSVPAVGLLVYLVGSHGALGYAAALLISWVVFAIQLTILDHKNSRATEG